MIRDPYEPNQNAMQPGEQRGFAPNNGFMYPGDQIRHDAPTEEWSLTSAKRPKIGPEQLIRPTPSQTPPGPLSRKISYLWHHDPAYRVFFVSIGVVVISCFVCFILIASAFAHIGQSSSTTTSNVPTTSTQTSNPTTTAQSTPTSTAPTAVPVVQIPPTPTPAPQITAVPIAPVPTPTPVIVTQLTVTITNAPTDVQNGQTVDVTVNTDQPGATVWITITATSAPYYTQLDKQQADANGNATFSWTIDQQSGFFTNKVTAYLTATAQDQNGQQANSQTQKVQIRTN